MTELTANITHSARRDSTLPRTWPWLWRLFAWYSRRYLRRHFHAVRISRRGPVPALDHRPTVVYLNHPSWWDPLICLDLARRAWPDRRHFAPIDRRALERYGFFRHLGFFGVDESRTGATAFLRTGAAVLASPGTMLWITAQGEFTDPRTRPVALAPGLARLLHRAGDVNVVPLAIEYPFWTERTPEALLRFGPVIDAHPHDVDTTHALLAGALERAMDGLAAEARQRDPGEFDPWLVGRSGVSAVYDRLRRVQARLTGRPYHSEHASVNQ